MRLSELKKLVAQLTAGGGGAGGGLVPNYATRHQLTPTELTAAMTGDGREVTSPICLHVLINNGPAEAGALVNIHDMPDYNIDVNVYDRLLPVGAELIVVDYIPAGLWWFLEYGDPDQITYAREYPLVSPV
jgi:hypothetical protein